MFRNTCNELSSWVAFFRFFYYALSACSTHLSARFVPSWLFLFFTDVLTFSYDFNGLTVNELSILEGNSKVSSCRNYMSPTCSGLNDLIERLQCRLKNSTSYYCCQRFLMCLKKDWLVCCLS